MNVTKRLLNFLLVAALLVGLPPYAQAQSLITIDDSILGADSTTLDLDNGLAGQTTIGHAGTSDRIRVVDGGMLLSECTSAPKLRFNLRRFDIENIPWWFSREWGRLLEVGIAPAAPVKIDRQVAQSAKMALAHFFSTEVAKMT